MSYRYDSSQKSEDESHQDAGAGRSRRDAQQRWAEWSYHSTVDRNCLKLWEAAVCLSFHLLMLMFRFQGADLRRVPLPASCHTGGSDQCHAAAWDLGNDQQVHDWPDSYPGETVSPAELSLLRSYRRTKGWTVKTICLISIFLNSILSFNTFSCHVWVPVSHFLSSVCVYLSVSYPQWWVDSGGN